MIEYNKSNISLAKALRKNMTRQERKFWYEFLRDYKPRFQRQKAIGDYIAGTNHTLPTSGTARFSSALSVDDFIKKTQYIYYNKNALKQDAYDVEYFANKEGLTAHAKSAVIRFED